MKILLAGLAGLGILVAGNGASHAAITCWYNAQGRYTGADDADPRFPVGKVTKGSGGGDYAYGYTVPGGPDTCPKTMPKK